MGGGGTLIPPPLLFFFPKDSTPTNLVMDLVDVDLAEGILFVGLVTDAHLEVLIYSTRGGGG